MSIQIITERVNRVEDTLKNRLNNTRHTLLAHVCARKWQLALESQIPADLEKTCKQLLLQCSTFEYRCAEMGEILTRCLCDLDMVMSQGQEEVKVARKAQVHRIQELLQYADDVTRRAATVKTIAHQWLSSACLSDNSEESESEPDVEEASVPEETMEEDDEDDDEEEEVSEKEKENEDECNEDSKANMECDDASKENQEMESNLHRLPMYTPRYQWSQDRSGLYLRLHLDGIHPENITASVRKGDVLLLSGYKWPTRRDLHHARYSGNPRYGRFLIKTTLPSHVDVSRTSMEHVKKDILKVHVPVARNMHRGFPSTFSHYRPLGSRMQV